MLMKGIRRFLMQQGNKDKGQGLVEYALLLSLISLISIGSLSNIGGKVNATFDDLFEEPVVIEYENDGFEARHNATIGRTGLLKKEAVTGLDNIDRDISVKVLANTNISGQIKSINPMTYGVYDADFKIPNNDRLLNGFFLYGYDNGVNYEIDIEIVFLDGEWKLWTTVFNEAHPNYRALHRKLIKEREEVSGKGNVHLDGGEVFMMEQPLGFDPTLDYHNYKIDVTSDHISFIVDGVERARWNESFEMYSLNLYAGTFYPFWLNDNIDAYNSLSAEDKESLRINAYDAYDSEGVMLEQLSRLLGEDVDGSFDIRKINMNRTR